MQQFIAGFICALVVVVPAAVVFVRRKFSHIESDSSNRLEQFEQLGRLTGQLAHEIKNPLSTVKVNLKLISEELKTNRTSDDDTKRKFDRALRKITVIRSETDRLEKILDGFLRYIDRGEAKLSDVDINELVSDMVDFYSPQAHSNSIMIRLGLYSEPLICKIDTDMLKQAILNLFINAREAMENGGELLVKTLKDNGNAQIQISDTGRGIAQGKLEKIFDVYYSSHPDGTGLGLPTAKKIIEAHKGLITVNSEQGKGTSFTINIPVSNYEQ